jgi:hypothetical protein
MSRRKKLSPIEKLERLSKLLADEMLADEELEIVDSPEAIEATRAAFLRIAHGQVPSSFRRGKFFRYSPAPTPSISRDDDIPIPSQFPKRKD